MTECNCPDEDKHIYNIEDCCKCTEHGVDMINRKIVVCSYCRQVKCSEVFTQPEGEITYDEGYPMIEEY